MPGHLLLVEDEFLIRLMLSEALLDAGHEVVDVADADEAAAALDAAARPFDVLLTDIQLAGPIDGHELARRVRARVPGIPVVFMTGHPEPLGEDASPLDRVLAKPFLPSEVCATVDALLGARSA